MTASGFWIGVEAMPVSVLRAAAEHERPIFCGRLSLDQGLRAELGDLYERAEWHDVALDTAIGQGYLMDLLRQRYPVASVVLALDVSTDEGMRDGVVAPVNEALAHARRITEGLLIVTRAAEAVMPPGSGALTVMLCGPRRASPRWRRGWPRSWSILFPLKPRDGLKAGVYSALNALIQPSRRSRIPS